MKRVASRAKWDDAVRKGKIVREHENLIDDGSLQCDRQLLLALGIAKEDKLLFCTKPNTEAEDVEAGDAETGGEVAVKTEERTNGVGATQDSDRHVSAVKATDKQRPIPATLAAVRANASPPRKKQRKPREPKDPRKLKGTRPDNRPAFRERDDC